MIPLIEAKSWNAGLQFFCKYCKKIHRHGFGDGNRHAHCMKQTPYTETGYDLILVEDKKEVQE